jgi:hypothetical protein
VDIASHISAAAALRKPVREQVIGSARRASRLLWHWQFRASYGAPAAYMLRAGFFGRSNCFPAQNDEL